MDASSFRSPLLVVMILLVAPITISSIYAWENALVDWPKYAVWSLLGTRPVWTVAIPTR